MLKVVRPPTTKVVTLQELKSRIRVAFDDDNASLETLLEAATEKFEERAMIVCRPTGFEMRLAGFARRIEIPAFPLRAVTQITYVDADGITRTVDASDYSIVETATGGAILFKDGWSTPGLHDDTPEPVIVEFEAGYDDPQASEATLPLKAKIKVAIMHLVGHWYDGGEDLPLGVESIAQQERVFR